jgi:hypothetical protein
MTFVLFMRITGGHVLKITAIICDQTSERLHYITLFASLLKFYTHIICMKFMYYITRCWLTLSPRRGRQLCPHNHTISLETLRTCCYFQAAAAVGRAPFKEVCNGLMYNGNYWNISYWWQSNQQILISSFLIWSICHSSLIEPSGK